ncbi:ABC-2 type transport system ATP-binding protein [Enterococcus rotai]|uniref:ABC transporter domain-containing protein n=1 Tax=Enterococcus rotai TaxID=118060 RepID=A0A0U2VEW5_9ENTE|nr:ABC transporter ATP-binding protein [Enterococcus rotai]ALS36075.1 hypothetical protein ATZ35_02530 [Enterococcus rotai]
MKNIICVNNMSKRYKNGSEEILKNISFEVNYGETFGILGGNGAGKSTLIKILATMLLHDSGDVLVLDKNVIDQYEYIKNHINFVFGGENGMYFRLTSEEYLKYFSLLYKIDSHTIGSKIDHLLKVVGLLPYKNNKIETFSKGMIQRLHIARSLINDPKILFLDEPTIGLDPKGTEMLKNVIREISKNGVTVILTTHYMIEAENLCDRVLFLNKGEIELINSPSNLINNLSEKYSKFELIIKKSMITKLNTAFPEIIIKENKKMNTDFTNINCICSHHLNSKFLKYLEVECKINDSFIESKKMNLEDVFLYHFDLKIS